MMKTKLSNRILSTASQTVRHIRDSHLHLTFWVRLTERHTADLLSLAVHNQQQLILSVPQKNTL